MFRNSFKALLGSDSEVAGDEFPVSLDEAVGGGGSSGNCNWVCQLSVWLVDLLGLDGMTSLRVPVIRAGCVSSGSWDSVRSFGGDTMISGAVGFSAKCFADMVWAALAAWGAVGIV